MTGRIEVVNRVSGRRRWTVEQKLAILQNAFGPDGALRVAYERHEVSAAQLYSWRRQALSGELTRVAPATSPVFAAVEVAKAGVDAPSASARRISIELPSGIRLTIDAGVDPQALARVLSVLRPRSRCRPRPRFTWSAARLICARDWTAWRFWPSRFWRRTRTPARCSPSEASAAI